MASDTSALQSVRAEEAPHKTLLEQITEDMERERARVSSRYMPTLTPKQFTEREKLIKELREMLVEGTDYGVIPGTEKPTLLLPGAQKVCAYFGYVPRYRFDVSIEEWNANRYGEPLFYYRLVCDLEKDGKPVGSGLGSCNSWESKYRYRWASESDARKRADFETLPTRSGLISEFDFAIDKRETQGQYGKPLEYWDRWQAAIESGEARHITKKSAKGKELGAWEMGGTQYRVPNEGYPDIINTVLKIGKKRAYIDSTLSATGLSQYFTQDLEDLSTEGIDTGGHPVGTQAAADHVAARKIDDSVDKELKPYLDLLSQPGGPKIAFEWIENQINAAGGLDGQNYYRDVQTKIKAEQAAKTLTVGTMRGHLIRLYNQTVEYRKLKAEAAEREKTEAQS